MALFLRFAALALLWSFSRVKPSAAVDRRLLDRLSWAAKIELCWRLVRDKRVALPVRALALLPALYLVSPIDILPDFIPVLGRIDDGMVFSVALNLLLRGSPPEVVREHLQQLRR